MALSIAINGENLFITGGGGVGKSYITNLIAQELENLGKNVLKCASIRQFNTFRNKCVNNSV